MNANVYHAIEAMLEADNTLTKTDRDKVLAVCRHPSYFEEPAARSLPMILTIIQTAKALQVSRTTVWRMVKAGKLRQLDHFGGGRFLLDDVEAFILQEPNADID
jgi:excisionase family DNA binding protein